MARLSAQDMLEIWETGHGQNPIERALTLLAGAHSPRGAGDFADMNLGERNALLLRLRAETFGEHLEIADPCPKCGEELEFTVSIDQLMTLGEGVQTGHWQMEFEDLIIGFRAPNSRDLQLMSRCATEAEAYDLLVKRLVTEVSRDGESVKGFELTIPIQHAIAEQIKDRDPLSEILFPMHCPEPGCGHAWKATLDIGRFFWRELIAHAREILIDVHDLARSFSWDENTILNMSGFRRKRYLELIHHE